MGSSRGRRWWGRRAAASPERRAPDPAAEAALRRAVDLVASGDLAAAESTLAETARGDSSSVDVYLALASLYRVRGEIGRAIQVHQNLILRPDLPESMRRWALLGLAMDFRAGGFLRRASAAFEEVLEVEPRNLEALRALERIQVERGDWREAIRTRGRIGSADPRTPAILAHLWTGVGRQAANAGREGEARRAFRRALSRDRSCAEAYLALGDQSERQGRSRRAIGVWKRALSLHPDIGRLLYPRLSRAHIALGDDAGFDALLRQRLGEAPTDAAASIWLARSLCRQNRPDEALTTLRAVLDRDPPHLAAHAELGRVLLRERRDFEALKAFQELLEHLPVDRSRLRCRSCGAQDTELHWRCPQCGEWDSW